jgi:hypothetical protein
MPNLSIDQINNPIPQEWTDYVTQSPVALEVIPDQLYSTLTYTDNTTLQLDFFAAVAANQGLSNMTQPGMLPNPQSFLIQAIRIFFRTTVNTVDMAASAASLVGPVNDMVLLVNTGRLVLTIGQKTYGPWRLWMLPAGSAVVPQLTAAGAEAAAQVSQYGQIMGVLWGMFPHLMIAPLQNFVASMLWPAAVDLSGDMVIEVLLDGQRARAVQ